MSSKPVYFVQITDTHIGSTAAYSRHGHLALPCAQRLVDLVNALPTRPDFVVHTGDMVADPDPAAYELAAQTFADLRMPIYYVNGNHDRAVHIHTFMSMGPKEDLSDNQEQLAYTFEVKGNRFLVLDTRGPDELDPRGVLSEGQLALVRKELAAEGPSLTLFLHHPLLPMNSPWMDAYMLTINGLELHKILANQDAHCRLRGVFYGHIHQHMQISRDGVLYVSAASAFSQFGAWPSDQQVSYDPDHPPGFNFVHLLPEQMIVHHHVFPRP